MYQTGGLRKECQLRRSRSHVAGCLLGGAVGDALGAAVEFMSSGEIRRCFGDGGITDYAPAYGRIGAITDDTQMTLFTAEGLILSRIRDDASNPGRPLDFVYNAYLRWLGTQGEVTTEALVRRRGTCGIIDGVLACRPELNSRRAPGNTCLSALRSKRMGTVNDPINDSKGCGGVMRVAPVGLFASLEGAFQLGCETAAITHGHPSGYLASGALAHILSAVSYGAALTEAIESAVEVLEKWPDHGETLAAVRGALDAWQTEEPSAEVVASLGQGWIAEEALAISLYCALCHPDDFEAGVVLAVNHGGDSDSTGAITGNILGLMLGKAAIPQRFLQTLELADLIEEVADDLYERMADIEADAHSTTHSQEDPS